MNRAAAGDELDWGDFDWVEGGADDHELAVGAESVDELGHGFGAGCGGQDYLCSAEFLEFFGGLGGFAVDVDVGSEFLCEGCVFGAASDGCDLVAELGGELDSEVAEAADALDCDEVGGERAAVAEGVEGGDSGAEEWGGFDVFEGLGDGCEGFDGGDHVLRVAAVVADAGDFEVTAVAEVSAATGEACAVLAAVPADSYALTFVSMRRRRGRARR